ncbi:MAG: HNH endonuclease [Deltaproteobacteria bacterium]|nr:HNH endonuclease [Deltaproteobacteria bacterium]
MPRQWYHLEADPKRVARERERARKLRKSGWWQARLAAGVCHYCQKAFKAAELTMDHIVPVARGGTSTRGNVVPACRACNASKKLETPAERLLRDSRIFSKCSSFTVPVTGLFMMSVASGTISSTS